MKAIDQVQASLSDLAVLEGQFLGLSMRLRDTYRHTSRMPDFMAWSALRRALFLVAGFRQMILDRNLVCAGALLRLQLDTALRFQSVLLVSDPDDFAAHVVAGTPVKNLQARTGEPLSDRFLVDNAAREFPWVPEVYQQASGFIHFSEKHFLSGQSAAHNSNGDIVAVVDSYDDVPDNVLIEAAEAFKRAADLLRAYVARWSEAQTNRAV